MRSSADMREVDAKVFSAVAEAVTGRRSDILLHRINNGVDVGCGLALIFELKNLLHHDLRNKRKEAVTKFLALRIKENTAEGIVRFCAEYRDFRRQAGLGEISEGISCKGSRRKPKIVQD